MTITIKDQEDKVLENVFLSLSAGKGFKLTGSTNSKGQYKFVGLHSGKFYLASILKEYEFDQPQLPIDLKDGDHAVKTLKAKRVAFSVYGSVSKLTGQPIEAARIIANCKNCDRTEESNVDTNGNYRLRGLIPGNTYSLSV